MLNSVLAFAGLCVVLAVTPGPDTFIVLRLAVRSGSGAGIAAAGGAAAGSLLWAVAAGVGLAALLANWGLGYTVVRALGALYLVYLGVQALRAQETTEASTAGVSERVRWWRAGGMGLLSAVLNPKIGLFFLAVVPQFVPCEANVVEMTFLLGCVDAGVAFAWLTLVSLGAARMMRWLNRPKVGATLERTTGVVLIGLGVVTLTTG
ncbi:LysE family translocator [Saccharomonospora viridis]|uniref:LysE family translocator n=1 Tax=Saccharomonospora viridis TaxID=1852 RepID=UPI0024A8E4FF|nr:LysE family translocator [Saccharomonospora viridis]